MRIQTKLFLTLLLASATLVTLLLILMQWSVDRGMLAYVNAREEQQLAPTVERLADYYRENGTFGALSSPRAFDAAATGMDPDELRRAGIGPGAEGARGRPPRRGEGHRPPPLGPGLTRSNLRPGVPDPRALGLLDAEQNMIRGRPGLRGNTALLPITVDDSVVGYLVRQRSEQVSDGFDLKFVEQQQETMLLAGLVVLLLSALLAFPLARHLVKPIGQLARGTARLTEGDYGTEIAIHRSDELGQLARDFNELSRALAANQDSRQRWFAAISHELRTPLAILRGEIEALLDGVRPLDLARIESLAEEIQQLNRLVEDLYDLSNADIGALKYRKESLDLAELVAAAVEQHRSALLGAKLSLEWLEPSGDDPTWGDIGRLRQLLDNLLTNSRKYTDPGGRVVLALTRQAQTLQLTVEDSGPGVADAELEHLFDHLYRVESSRNRATGGSGLGLAISRQIAIAHEGRLEATHSSLGGVRITLTLPAVE